LLLLQNSFRRLDLLALLTFERKVSLEFFRRPCHVFALKRLDVALIRIAETVNRGEHRIPMDHQTPLSPGLRNEHLVSLHPLAPGMIDDGVIPARDCYMLVFVDMPNYNRARWHENLTHIAAIREEVPKRHFYRVALAVLQCLLDPILKIERMRPCFAGHVRLRQIE